MADMVDKGRSLTDSRHPHHLRPEIRPIGERHGQAKLTDAIVREIRQRYIRGVVTQSSLAVKYGVSRTVVARVLLGQSWQHVS
jgi:hypothetical protein